MEALGVQRRSVVLVPYPIQGHMTPILQLGSVLHLNGFSVTVVHPELNAPNPNSHPEFSFVTLPDGLAGSEMSFSNQLDVISAMNTNCKESFKECMAELNAEVACIIYDVIMWFVDPVAVELKIPTIVLRTTSAAYMHSIHATFQLEEQKVLPVTESQLEEIVPNLNALRFKDLPFPATTSIYDYPKSVIDFFESYLNNRSSSAVIWNTLEMLEHSELKLQQQHWQLPFFSIGPLERLAPAIQTSIMKEDTSCLLWLDNQAPDSVIYVSLGSLAIVDKEAFLGMAWGLANSEQPFLWVLRSSLLDGPDPMECLPEDFFKITKERACIVKWAPQKKVLAHRSVGGFFTHCGWNSTLESMCEGVPVICRPCFQDQAVNARYVTHVWKIGLELETTTDRCIEEAVRKLLVSEEGKEFRKKALDMKQKLQDSISRGGLSYKSLQNLVEFIISLPDKKRQSIHILKHSK